MKTIDVFKHLLEAAKEEPAATPRLVNATRTAQRHVNEAIATEPVRPMNCGTSFCSCIECVVEPVEPSAAEREALIEELRYPDWGLAGQRMSEAANMLAADAVRADKRVAAIAADREYWREQAQQVAVPQGYALVPIEPTAEMRVSLRLFGSLTSEQTRQVYLAVLSAAPQPPQAAPRDACDSPKLCAVNGSCAGQYGTKKKCDAPRVPMTPEQARDIWKERDSVDIIRKVEQFHGIGAKS